MPKLGYFIERLTELEKTHGSDIDVFVNLGLEGNDENFDAVDYFKDDGNGDGTERLVIW